MARVALEFTYHIDIIEVPGSIANSIKKIQKNFDKWIYDKSVDHGCWIIEKGHKKGVAFDTTTFVNYLNSQMLNESEDKARIVQTNLKKLSEKMPVLYF